MRPRNNQVIIKVTEENMTEGGVLLVGECKRTYVVTHLGPDVENLKVGDLVLALDQRERIYDVPEIPGIVVCNQEAILAVE